MGVFQSIYNIGPQGKRYRKAKFKLERAQANKAIADIQSQQELRKVEDPREQAHMKQTLFGRGLGKSTIAEQDTSRLTGQQAARNAALDRAMHAAVRYKQYIKKRQRYERKAVYAQMLDSLVSLAGGIGGGGGSTLGIGENTGTDYGTAQGWGTNYQY